MRETGITHGWPRRLRASAAGSSDIRVGNRFERHFRDAHALTSTPPRPDPVRVDGTAAVRLGERLDLWPSDLPTHDRGGGHDAHSDIRDLGEAPRGGP